MVCAIVAFSVAHPAAAQSANQGPTAEELHDVIQSLKERIDQLEQQVEALREAQETEPAPAPEIEERLTEIESNIEEEKQRAANDFRVFWKDSLRFETQDGNVKLRIGGHIHNDWAWFDQDNNLEFIWDPDTAEPEFVDAEDGVEFRRARIYLSGELWENIEFKIQFDFAGGDADFRDVYVGVNELGPIDHLRIGQFKEPFSLEELTSSNDITFMERALPNIFAPSRNTGAMVKRTWLNDRLWAAAGVFRDTDDFGNDQEDGAYAVTARIAGLPWYAKGGRRLIHLGAAYSHREEREEFVRFRQRPEANLAPRFLNTGRFRADDMQLYGLEAAAVYGPFSIQGEYMKNEVDTILAGDVDFDGWYVYGSWIPTGEHRRYDLGSAAFKNPKPNRNFNIWSSDRGWGAWELTARYSELDLSDGIIVGGAEENITLGVNWYLNPNTRVMVNYTNADIKHPLFGGDLDIFQTRLQFAF